MVLRTKFNSMGLPNEKDIDFVRPNLTANGTMGGNAFAVSASSANSSYPAYQAVDSSTSTQWRPTSTGSYYYYFYNPKALNVSKVILTFSGTNYRAGSVTIAGSNDNSTWETITSSYSGTTTGTLTTTNNKKYYKYHRLYLTTYSSTMRVTNIAITATYKG